MQLAQMADSIQNLQSLLPPPGQVINVKFSIGYAGCFVSD